MYSVEEYGYAVSCLFKPHALDLSSKDSKGFCFTEFLLYRESV